MCLHQFYNNNYIDLFRSVFLTMATELLPEEINNLRLSALLLKTGPRAVRVLFDRFFPPGGLQTVLNMEKISLEKLKKKRVINQAQWNLLYGTSQITSSEFDITLMACLLRNLTSLSIKDIMPSKTDTSPGADVSRIKHFRNLISHSEDGKISQQDFNETWDNLSNAIVRLGGQSFVQECCDIKVASLNQHDKELLLEIRQNTQEIQNLNEVVNSLKNPIPINVKEIMKLKVETWKTENKLFVETKAAKFLLGAISENSIVTVIGNPGIGKSSLIHHVAMCLHQGENCEIVPVHFPLDIMNYNNPDQSQVFIIDDVCGKYSLSTQLAESWEIYKDDIESILRARHTKILLSCRTNIFRSQGFQKLKLLTSSVCDLSSPNLALSTEDLGKIASVYLSNPEADIVKDILPSSRYDFFPLLCKLYPEHRQHNIKDFFTRPVHAIEENLTQLQLQNDKMSFCSLALLVLYNNAIEDNWLSSILSDEDKQLLQLLFEECEMNCVPSRKTLKRQLEMFLGSYVIHDENKYKALHDKLFDILAVFVGTEMFDFILQYGNIEFVSERYQFESLEADNNGCYIPVPIEKECEYFKRILRHVDKAFDNRQLAFEIYRKKFTSYCYTNKLDIVKRLRQFDESDTRSPLVIAVTSGYDEIVKMLIDFKMNVNIRDVIGRSMVSIAIENEYTSTLSILLKAKADANIADQQGFTPLCVAAGMGKKALCQMLLTYGADPNKRSLAGVFPLYWASYNRFPDVVKVLCDFNADVNLQNNNGWTSLYVACRNGSTDIVDLLLQQKADPNILQKNFGVSPLFEAVSRGQLGTVKMLLDHHANFKELLNGRYCLCEAVERGHTDVVRVLLEYGSDPNVSDQDDNYPLLLATSINNVDITSVLVRFGANINQCSKHLHTPLSIASYFGRASLVKYLLENGADISSDNDNNETALHIAVRSTNPKVVELLLAHKSDPNVCNVHGNSCLSEAAFYGREDSVKILIKNKAEIDSSNKLGETPLFRAGRAGNLKVVETLLLNNADVNKYDNEGNSPLSEAAFYGYFEIVLLLLEHNADPNSANTIGSGALHRAAGSGKCEIVEALLNFGADPSICNSLGLTPLDIASVCQHHDIYETILHFESF
ncbi:Hypothetical predicted protein [Mytilus galloprovincialis]|uniref:DZIP3-like HEPN domain-containing protein n=1 Tax=Mytilus galloprovincialis TaxID=29158 RepID=A0A8B6HKB1_MYTGA|nr:Hypothetical predicted protein [Mytilus galloprovincialis]